MAGSIYQMPYVIQIVSRVDDTPTEFDGQYLVAYDPAYRPDGEAYDGGLLMTVVDRGQAMRFDTPGQALEKWRESYGIRPDGRPNRPLTAFNIQIALIDLE